MPMRNLRVWSSMLVCMAALVLSSCGPSSSKHLDPPVEEMVGTSGGMLETESGFRVAIPSGALGNDVVITVQAVQTASDATPPAPNVAPVSTTFRLGPEGQTFEQPVEVAFPIDLGALPPGTSLDDVVVMRAPAGTRDFVRLPTRRIDASTVGAITDHFSDFVAGVQTMTADSSAGPSCGDRTCDTSETCEACPYDCGLCFSGHDPNAMPICGDRVCAAASETCASCAYDCGDCSMSTTDGSVTSTPVCGNGQCEAGEACDACVADCGVCAGADASTSTDGGASSDGGTTGICGNGQCDAMLGESCASCPTDCIAFCVASGCTANDTDSMSTVRMNATRIQIPSGTSATYADGVNVDGQATASTSDGAGCFVRDTKADVSATVSDIDDQYAAVATAMATLGIDSNAGIADAMTAGTFGLGVELGHWNGAATDTCVEVRLYRGATMVGTGEAVLNQGRIADVAISGSLSIPQGSTAPAGCVEQLPTVTCDGRYDVVVHTLRAKLFFDPAITQLATGSLVGGAILWDNGGSAPPTSPLAPDLQASMIRIGQGAQWSTTQSILSAKRDLRLVSDTQLGACSGTSQASSNANAISFGLLFDQGATGPGNDGGVDGGAGTDGGSTPSACGNATCEPGLGETCTTCRVDCGASCSVAGCSASDADANVSSRFVASSIRIPSGASATVVAGVDVDGRATTSTADSGGCFVRDTQSTGGDPVAAVDNQWAAVSTALATLGLDNNLAISNAVTDGTFGLSVELGNWNGTDTDPCIEVRLYRNGTLVGTGDASLAGGRVDDVALSGLLYVPQGASNVAGCIPDVGMGVTCDGRYDMLVHTLRARLVFDPTMAHLAVGSFVGGSVFWNARGEGLSIQGELGPVLQDSLTRLGQGAQWSTSQAIINGKADLRLVTDTQLSACVGTSTATSNANSISFALAIDDGTVVGGGADGGVDGGSSASCGDGVVQIGEDCDDMNLGSGDGCSPVCLLEPGWSCQGAPSSCQMTGPSYCGDAICDASTFEDCSSCSADCGTCGGSGDGGTGGASCGNTQCDVMMGETCASCPSDCAAYCVATGCTASDGDSMMRSIALTRIQIPNGSSSTVADGVNVDGVSTSSTSDPAGCFVRDTRALSTDTVSAVDDQYAAINTAVATLGTDNSQSITDAMAAGTFGLTVQLDHWNGSSTDTCVGVSLYRNGVLVGTGEAVMSQGTIPDVGISGLLSVPQGTQNVAGCVPNLPTVTCDGRYDVVVHHLRAKLVFDPATTSIVSGSALGGAVLWSTGAEPLTVSGALLPTLQAATTATGQASSWPTVQSMYASKRDLRLITDDQLESCTGTSAASGNQNSISFGLAVDSVSPPPTQPDGGVGGSDGGSDGGGFTDGGTADGGACTPMNPMQACIGTCGSVDNGCGQLIDCEANGFGCAMQPGTTCGGGGMPGVCGSTAPSGDGGVSDGGTSDGGTANYCGNTQCDTLLGEDCASCPSDCSSYCAGADGGVSGSDGGTSGGGADDAGSCVPSTAASTCSAPCGLVSDGCGGSIDCSVMVGILSCPPATQCLAGMCVPDSDAG